MRKKDELDAADIAAAWLGDGGMDTLRGGLTPPVATDHLETKEIEHMSNMYQVSYDLSDSTNTDNDWALKELIRELRDDVMATRFDRPVATTLHFLSESDRFAIYKAVTTWAGKVGAYWMVSLVKETNDPGTYCYQEGPKESLQTRIDEILSELDDEDDGERKE